MARNKRDEGAGANFSVRLPSGLRASLETEARKKGKSLNHEIRVRLAQSFDRDQALVERFGGKQSYAVWRLLSCLPFQGLTEEEQSEVGDSWLHDLSQFKKVETATRVVLAAISPEALSGDVAPPKSLIAGFWLAEQILRGLKDGALDLTAIGIALGADLEEILERVPDDFAGDERIRRSLLGDT